MNLHLPLSARSGRGLRLAFSLIELLVVMVIIGILARIALPAFKGLGQGNVSASANRQLLDELAFARLTAINERTTVYMVFVPLLSQADAQAHRVKLRTPRQLRQMTNVLGKQLTGYALFTKRGVGSQPGQLSPRYLTEWKALPEGMVFQQGKFVPATGRMNVYQKPFWFDAFPFPSADAPEFRLPYLAFNSSGQLVGSQDEIIPLSRGTVFFGRDAEGNAVGQADVDISPKDNTNSVLRVGWLTGRANVIKPVLP
ncbi:MAG: prepilin-type N-terminal cleavage/methylation domain-containing protein [Verrucomicrobia bacterium]|nr:prepilin-type N-terminal cleavage/methylation domain-containing protein [Verrucomicrobiota bacterium]